MSGKKGPPNRQKGQISAKSGGKTHFQPKAQDGNRSSSQANQANRNKKLHAKQDDDANTTTVEGQEPAIPRQGRLKPAPALIAALAARPTGKSLKLNSNSALDHQTTQEKPNTGGDAQFSETPTSPATASDSTSTTPANNPTAPPKRIFGRGVSSAPRQSSTPTATLVPPASVELASTEIAPSSEALNPLNPKKRKAPEQRIEPEAQKKRSPAPNSPDWFHPISDINPMDMTIEQIDAEIIEVKSAISTLKEAIRLVKFHPPA